MDNFLKATVIDFLSGKTSAVGFAPIDRFKETPWRN